MNNRSPRLLACALLAGVSVPTAADARLFILKASAIVIEQPAPLFTTDRISGRLELADDIAPGESFGSASILDLKLNFGGIEGTLAQIQADIAPGPVQGFGTRSLDGRGFSVFDLRFGFQNATAACSFICVGQIIINSPVGPNDPSNFFAFDAFDDNSLSLITSYTASFQAVPEPTSWALLILGFGLVGAALRRTPVQQAEQEISR